MEYISPDVGYIALVVGIMVVYLALISPGSGLFEVVAVIALLIAGYCAWALRINPWAVVVLVVSLVPFLYALAASRWRPWLLSATVLLVIVGSIFLFINEKGLPAVNPILATLVSLFYGGFVYISVERMIRAMQQKPVYEINDLIGQTGEAKSEIHAQGSAQVAGELWSARSENPIGEGSKVRVIARDGFVLIVEKVQ